MMMNICAAAVILQIESKAAIPGSGRRLIPGKEAARSGVTMWPDGDDGATCRHCHLIMLSQPPRVKTHYLLQRGSLC